MRQQVNQLLITHALDPLSRPFPRKWEPYFCLLNRPLVQTIGARASKRFAVVFTLSPFLFLCSGVISLEHPDESGYLAPVEPGVREFPQQHAEVASTSLKILASDGDGFWRLTSTLDVHATVTHVL
ncbi:hypothetical protein K0M31_016913, partial [Melipona bicolor]